MFVGILLLFLSIRIYYRIKLLKLTNVLFSYSLIEKRFIGIVSVFLIRGVIILIINVYLSLVFRVSLEFLSFKLSIYLLIIFFFFLSVYTNLHFKFNVYDKIKNFKEI